MLPLRPVFCVVVDSWRRPIDWKEGGGGWGRACAGILAFLRVSLDCEDALQGLPARGLGWVAEEVVGPDVSPPTLFLFVSDFIVSFFSPLVIIRLMMVGVIIM